MERAKLAFFVAVAFFAAAFLGALAFRSDDLLRPAGRAQAILVEVENEGHDATVALEAQRASGGPVSHWEWRIPSGSSQTARVAGPSAEMLIRVEVEWTDATRARTASGETRYLVDPADCPGGELTLHLRADTSNGVSIERAAPNSCRQ